MSELKPPQLVLGVDPGLTTGLLAMRLSGQANWATAYKPIHPIAAQIHGHASVVTIVEALVADALRTGHVVLLAVEAFVIGPRAARSSSAHAGRITRDLIAEMSDFAERGPAELAFASRPAAAVKPWATDQRLSAAGLLDGCAGMGHARDAARHALFAAVHAQLMRDPLSKAAAR